MFSEEQLDRGDFSGVPGDDHRCHESHKAVIALSWVLYTVVGVSLMDIVSVLMLWRMTVVTKIY